MEKSDGVVSPALIEGGHYYQANGPNEFTFTTWNVANQVRALLGGSSSLMVFVDDVHSSDDMKEADRGATKYPDLVMDPQYTILESDMIKIAHELLGVLDLKLKPNKSCFLAGIKLTNEKHEPTCVLLDVALSCYKLSLGYENLVNVLPDFYAGQQRKVLTILEKLENYLPKFNFVILLCDVEGKVTDSIYYSHKFLTKVVI